MSTLYWKAWECRSQDLNIVLLSQFHTVNLLSGFIFLFLKNINNISQTKQNQQTSSIMKPFQTNTNYNVSVFRIQLNTNTEES